MFSLERKILEQVSTTYKDEDDVPKIAHREGEERK